MADDLIAKLLTHRDNHPDRVGLVFEPAFGRPRVELSYRQIADRAEDVARQLLRRVGPGQRALLLLPSVPEFVHAFLGCLAAGVVAVPVPLPWDESSRRRVLAVARNAGISLVLSISEVQEFLTAMAPELAPVRDSYEWLLIDQVAAESEGSVGRATSGPAPDPDGAGIAFLQYTSGSTGSPKGVEVTYANLSYNEEAIRKAFDVTPDSTIVSWLPLNHDMGLIGGLLQPLHTGARAVISDPSNFVRNPVSWLETISREPNVISGGPNFAYDLCVRKVTPRQLAELDLSGWTVAFNGAAQVFPSTLRRFTEQFGPVGFRPSAHLACYGLAESTLLVAATAPDAPPPSREFSVSSLDSGTAAPPGPDDDHGRELVGYPLPDHATVRVVDPDTLECRADGVLGEIVVASPSNARGYWKNPEATAATFGLGLPDCDGAGYLRTGDLGFRHDGLLFVSGRSKDLMVYRGRNLHPEDLEADIVTSDGDLRPGCGAVVSVPADGDEAIVVCQEVRKQAAPERYPELTLAIRRTLARAHGVAAHTVLLVPAGTLPKTTSGKLQRHRIRDLFLAGQVPVLHRDVRDTAHGDTAPDDPGTEPVRADAIPTDHGELAALIAEQVRQLLDLPEPPRRTQSLAELGADSLHALQIQHTIEQRLGVAIPPSLLLGATSIDDLARAALTAGTRSPTATAGDRHPETYGLTSAQQALWFLQQTAPDSFDYNVTRVFRWHGDLDPTRLSDALRELAKAHPSLRLNLATVAGRPEARLRPDDAPPECEFSDASDWSDDELRQWHHGFATRPFDLARDSLIKAAVLRRDGHHLLALGLHHIVCDLSSVAVLVADLAQLYAGGTVTPCEVTPWHAAEREKAVLAQRGEALADFWRQTLRGDLPAISLPGNPQHHGSGEALRFRIDPELTKRLTRFARSRRLTPHNLLLAVFQVLLHRLTGQTDLLVGVPASTRDHQLRTWIGYLVNVVPVRSAFDPSEPFSGFAERTQQDVLAALDHKDLAFADILRHVGVNRDAPNSSPVQAMFSYYASTLPGVDQTAARIVMGDPDVRLTAGPATLEAAPFPEYTTQSDICLNVAPHGAGLAFEIQYAPDRVPLDQARLLGTLYPTLLESVAAGGDAATTGGLAWLRPEEQQAVIAASRGPDIPRPGDYLDTFEAMADRFPDREAISDPRTRLSYAELDQRSNQVAGLLSARGVGPERSVVVCAERSVDTAIALLGIHKSDGCYLPIPPSEAPRRMAAMVAAGAPVLALADAAGRPAIAEALRAAGLAGVPVLDLAEACAGSSPDRPGRLRPDEGAAYILFTSGSSGQPKPVVCANAAVTNHIWQMVEHLGIGPEDRVGQVSPISVDLTVWQLMSPLMVGGRSHVVPEPASLSADGLLAGLRAGITMVELVPTDIVALLDAGLADDPGALRAMLATGDAMPPDLPRRWRREVPAVPLYNAYGSTECTDDVSIGLSAWGPDHPATLSIGRPLANTSMYIVDPQLRPAPRGAPGYLYVGGRGVSRGYHGDPRRTALAFVPDPYSRRPGARLYRTGDLVRALPGGDVEFGGRVDNQVNLRGLRVEPGEIEAALRECDRVADAAVKLERGRASDLLVAYLVMTGPAPATPDGKGVVLGSAEDFPIRAALTDALPRYMIPSIFVRLPRLPRTGTLKVDYRALSFEPATGPADPADQGTDSPLAATVRAAWTEQLGTPVTGPEDSFFYLGGHSLAAFAMTSRLETSLGVRLDVGLIFRHPRFAEFVKAVAVVAGSARTRTTPDAAASGETGPVPASSAQERFWFLRELAPDSAAYNMPGVLCLTGDLDDGRLERAIRRVLSGHPVLLARFSDRQGSLTWTPAPVDSFELTRSDLRGAVAEFGEEAFDLVVEQYTASPADLRGGLPLRAHLVRVADREWRLVMVVDHIVSDGWSLSVFLNDLADRYNTDAPPAAPSGYRFADYCRDERRDRPTVAELAPLWAGVGQGPVRLSPLPEPGGRLTGRRSDQVAVDFPPATAQALHTLAGTTGTTPFMVLAAGLAALIHSGSDQREQVLLGTLIAHRDRPEWRELVGPLLNVSLIAVNLATSDTGRQLLDGVRESVLRCYRSSRLPFQDLVTMLPPVDDGTGSPFAVMLNLLPPVEPPPRFAGLETELRELDPIEAPYQLTIDIGATGDGWYASCRYLADLHDQDSVSELLRRFVHVVAALATRPDAPVAELLSDLTVGGSNRG